MSRSINFARGELVGAARAYLAIYMRMRSGVSCDDQNVLLTSLDAQGCELERLIGNLFCIRNEPGNLVEISLLILFMNGESHIASENPEAFV